VIATPDHTQGVISMAAMEAGKHVFCQKPLTLTLEENQLIRNACRKHPDKVFFIGTQQRSDRDRFLRAVNMVQKGLIGDVKKITVGINGGDVGGPFEKHDPPGQLDWERWLGQAPLVDYRHQRCHGNFRWWYEYSGGKFTDWGAHHIDIALWALQRNDEGQGPVTFDGTDAKHPVPFEHGYPTKDDSYNTAHDYAVKCTFDDGIEMIVTSRGDNGLLFEGTKGRFFVNRGKITGQPIEENWDEGQFSDEDLQRLYKDKPFEGHKQNFYRCLSEGGLPVSDVYSHLQTMASCHLSAIAARLNRVIQWDPSAEKIVGDEEAAAFFAREQRKGYEIPQV
jgi:predicted dehydrogenase